MTTFHQQDLEGAEFTDSTLRGARIVGCDVSGLVVRGSAVQDVEVDSPWLFDGDNSLVVNGVDVLPFVDAELDRRFPGRSRRRAADPEGLRGAWSALEAAWAALLARAATLPEGAIEERVKGEWSFAETLRHLVLATDLWLGKAVLRHDQPFHPLGLVDSGTADDGFDVSGFATDVPSYAQVLEARAGRVAMVRDFLAEVTAEQLAEQRPNPHDPSHAETVLSCVHTILDEEWEHHRYAVRDLDTLEAATSREA